MSKLIMCDGKTYTVHDMGALMVRLARREGGPPIKAHGTRIVEDGEARAELRELIDSGLYEREV